MRGALLGLWQHALATHAVYVSGATGEVLAQRIGDYAAMVVAVLGTTISPYLFFWQASQEVEELRLRGRQSRVDSPKATRRAVRRMRLDTIVDEMFAPTPDRVLDRMKHFGE